MYDNLNEERLQDELNRITDEMNLKRKNYFSRAPNYSKLYEELNGLLKETKRLKYMETILTSEIYEKMALCMEKTRNDKKYSHEIVECERQAVNFKVEAARKQVESAIVDCYLYNKKNLSREIFERYQAGCVLFNEAVDALTHLEKTMYNSNECLLCRDKVMILKEAAESAYRLDFFKDAILYYDRISEMITRCKKKHCDYYRPLVFYKAAKCFVNSYRKSCFKRKNFYYGKAFECLTKIMKESDASFFKDWYQSRNFFIMYIILFMQLYPVYMKKDTSNIVCFRYICLLEDEATMEQANSVFVKDAEITEILHLLLKINYGRGFAERAEFEVELKSAFERQYTKISRFNIELIEEYFYLK